ncbi:outer membrane beta-barrel protein [Pararhodonellum marinum]|uniref:outer membrane beta-barrel protein n=1 Tax=Pararhodonellum marinum TaxID=2755358 RepID=UPI00188EE6F2|nr:outer membrane beta-barrel protein [Pararhodonellum marinum]
MKRIALLSILLVFAFSAHAQFEEEEWFVGGVVNANSFRTDNHTNNRFNRTFFLGLNPRFGKFISPRSVLGFGPGYNLIHDKTGTMDSSTSPWDSSSKREFFTIGVFYRRYFPILNNFTGFIALDFDFGNEISRSGENRNHQINTGLSPGLAYRINQKWMIESTFGGLFYSWSQEKSNDNLLSRNRNVGFNLFSGAGIGVVYFLNPKKTTDSSAN